MESVLEKLAEDCLRRQRTLRVHKMTEEYLASIARERLKEKAGLEYCEPCS